LSAVSPFRQALSSDLASRVACEIYLLLCIRLRV
jgi:hypothetical protein